MQLNPLPDLSQIKGRPMKQFASAATLTFALLALLSLARPAAAGEQVSFTGSLEGDLTRTPLVPPFVLDELEATGTAAHLGQFDLLISATVNLNTRSAVGTYVFVAANGDTLTATFTGKSTPTETPGVILIVETATITGGTGRFDGAGGSFTVERLFSPADGTTVGSIEGTISTVGSNKR
jgi:hypothetical protein